jgi:hypothetical protein
MLNDVYVNLYIAQDRGKPIIDDEFLRIGDNLKRIVFTATAGAGKSMLMRY